MWYAPRIGIPDLGGFGPLVRCLRAERLRPGFFGRGAAVNRVASRPAAQAVRTSVGRCPPAANPAIASLARPIMEAAIPSTRSTGDQDPVPRARRAGGASAVAPA